MRVAPVTAGLLRGDGGGVIEVRRFEVPNPLPAPAAHRGTLRTWYLGTNLTTVHLAGAHTGSVLCRLYPEDKTRDASGLRRAVDPVSDEPSAPPPAPASAMAPMLAKLIAERAASGLPPAYLPKDEPQGAAPMNQ